MGKFMLWALVLLLLSIVDIPGMWRKKAKYEMWMFAILLVFAAAYGVLFDLNVSLPDPKGIEQMLFEPIGKKILVPSE